ncbi:hypothetical protein [Glaciihabitans sp. dw_435]|uniref:hypothetical protein n=1 Tax=Glaciihabitans sp. dw_435 TaxID=2720081 RepID=UPI001BD3A22E|nr:hypothetical protein [Glaciihabitans sp. dw_435]
MSPDDAIAIAYLEKRIARGDELIVDLKHQLPAPAHFDEGLAELVIGRQLDRELIRAIQKGAAAPDVEEWDRNSIAAHDYAARQTALDTALSLSSPNSMPETIVASADKFYTWLTKTAVVTEPAE